MHSAFSPLGAVSTHIHSAALSVTVGDEGLRSQDKKIRSMATPEAIAQRVMKRFIR